MTKRALLILNPAARNAPPIEKLQDAIDGLDGWEVALEQTNGPGHATALAAGAAKGELDVVIACGGDGTVNEVVNGLAGSRTALAVVRGGTANVWAKEARLPKDASAAIRLVAEGEERVVDLGRANERYFLLMAGVGLDAAIVRDVSPTWKRRIGAAAYLLHGISVARRYQDVEAELLPGLSGNLCWLLVANVRNYAGLVELALHAQVDDGKLDVCLLRKGGLRRLAWLAPWVVLRRHDRRAHVEYRQQESLDVATPGLPVQLDGEYAGETPMRFEVAPGALRVIVPRGQRRPIFS
ncbi:MAG: diacylglycerol kinase family protein, partial [Dehalococcoidia bacterium]